MSAKTRVKAILSNLSGKTITDAKSLQLVKALMNYPEGTGEEICQAYLVNQLAIYKANIRAHAEQKKLDEDNAALVAIADDAIAGL